MKLLVTLLSAVLAVNGLSNYDHWTNFKSQHGKRYNIVEEKLRFQIFQDNLQTINQHNARYEAGLETYYMGVNKFADMTTKEFDAMLQRQKIAEPTTKKSLHVQNVAAPDSIDWREKTGVVLEVKDQGKCGSCWAFSTTGAIEGQNALINNKSVSLSEQQLMDCSREYGNLACDGGYVTYAFEYVLDYGLQAEDTYGYTHEQGLCYASGDPVVKIKDYKELEAGEENLKNAVGTVGPISIMMYASPLQFYDGGIFKRDDCVSFYTHLNHALIAVGYGNDPEPYWIIKNSWGTTWGEKGFFKLARNVDQCGVGLRNSYPVL